MKSSPTVTVEVYTVSRSVKHKCCLSHVQLSTLNASDEVSDFPVDFDNFTSDKSLSLP